MLNAQYILQNTMSQNNYCSLCGAVVVVSIIIIKINFLLHSLCTQTPNSFMAI